MFSDEIFKTASVVRCKRIYGSKYSCIGLFGQFITECYMGLVNFTDISSTVKVEDNAFCVYVSVENYNLVSVHLLDFCLCMIYSFGQLILLVFHNGTLFHEFLCIILVASLFLKVCVLYCGFINLDRLDIFSPFQSI